jgi:hypothetical protein
LKIMPNPVFSLSLSSGTFMAVAARGHAWEPRVLTSDRSPYDFGSISLYLSAGRSMAAGFVRNEILAMKNTMF